MLMKRLRAYMLQFLALPVPAAVPLVLGAAGLLIYSFVGDDVPDVVRYSAYGVSAYALAVFCITVTRICKSAAASCKKSPFYGRIQADVRLRVRLSLYGSLGFNCAFALMHAASGLLEHSIWFSALAGYYSMLAFIRGMLLRGIRRKSLRFQWQTYRLCGIFLAVMHLALAVIVYFIVQLGYGFHYHAIHTIAMEAYAFTAVTMAIVNAVRYRKYHQPLLSAGKAVGMAAALVSMLSLETAMLNAFGSESAEGFRRAMTLATGTGVCALVLGIGIYMIVRSTKALRKIGGSSAARNTAISC